MSSKHWPPVPSPETSLSSDRRSPPSALLLRAAALPAARRRPTPPHPRGPGRPPPAPAEQAEPPRRSQGPGTAGANGRTWRWLLKSVDFRMFWPKKRGERSKEIMKNIHLIMLKISSGNLTIFNDIQMFHHFLAAVSKSMRFCRWQLRHFNPSSKDHHSLGR